MSNAENRKIFQIVNILLINNLKSNEFTSEKLKYLTTAYKLKIKSKISIMNC